MTTKIYTTKNQFGQTVKFFAAAHDSQNLIAEIDGVKAVTDFQDLLDFLEPNSAEPSEYMPVLVGGKILCYVDLA